MGPKFLKTARNIRQRYFRLQIEASHVKAKENPTLKNSRLSSRTASILLQPCFLFMFLLYVE
jgi:hypothetical protein